MANKYQITGQFSWHTPDRITAHIISKKPRKQGEFNMKKKIFAAICSVTMLAGTAAFAPDAVLFGSSDAIVAEAYSGYANGCHWEYEMDITGYRITRCRNYQHLTSITIPSVLFGTPVTAIDDNAFVSGGDSNCQYVETVTIPEGVYRIGNCFFQNCKKLKYVNFPSSLKLIGSYVFSGCSKLQNINVPNNVERIGSRFCENATSLTSATLGTKLEMLGDYGFYGCSAMTSFSCPSQKITQFGYGSLWANRYADNYLATHNDLVLGSGTLLYRYVGSSSTVRYNNVKYVFDYAFGGDAWTGGSSVNNIYLPQATTFGTNAFKKVAGKNVHLNATVCRNAYGSNYKSIVENFCKPAIVKWDA